jgi:hypothetical protein
MTVKALGRPNLRRELKKEGIANASRDLDIAAEWFPLEEEAARAFGIAESIAEFQARRGYDGPSARTLKAKHNRICSTWR